MPDSHDLSLTAVLRTMQLIAFALLTGLLVFLGIVVYQVSQRQAANPPPQVLVLTYLATGFLPLMALLSYIVPRLLIRATLQRIAAGTWKPSPQGPNPPSDTGKLLLLRQTVMIVGMALLEGVCFLGCIAYLVEGQLLALGVPIIGVVLLLMKFPTRFGVESWLSEQLDQLDQLRRQ